MPRLGWALGLSVPDHPVALGTSSYKEAGKVWFVGHFVLSLRTFSRVVMAMTVRFSFRAIKGLSIFDSSNAKSCASSWGVHGRPMGRGPSLISSPSARSCSGWPSLSQGAVTAHRWRWVFAEARELSRQRSCRPRASRPVSFSRRRSIAAVLTLKGSFLRLQPDLD
jgi:hypothetical protein